MLREVSGLAVRWYLISSPPYLGLQFFIRASVKHDIAFAELWGPFAGHHLKGVAGQMLRSGLSSSHEPANATVAHRGSPGATDDRMVGCRFR